MTGRKKVLIGLMVLIGVIFVAGVTAVAVSNYGTQSNPLVTKSYIDDVVAPDILSELSDEIKTQSTALENKFKDQIKNYSGGAAAAVPSSFEVVMLAKSEVIRCSVGTEIMLRSGKATCYGGSAPRLVDTTDGSTLDVAGSDLTANHMYLVTLDNNGLRAQADDTVILVSGTYTVYDNL